MFIGPIWHLCNSLLIYLKVSFDKTIGSFDIFVCHFWQNYYRIPFFEADKTSKWLDSFTCDTTHLHSSFTQLIYTAHLHSSFTQLIYTAHLHSSFTQLIERLIKWITYTWHDSFTRGISTLRQTNLTSLCAVSHSFTCDMTYSDMWLYFFTLYLSIFWHYQKC